MPSSRALAFAVFLLATNLLPSRADAEQPAQGFAVERFYPSAPGGGWFVMDDLTLHGGLGGGVALTTGYAMKPLRVTDGVRHLAVVSDQAFTDVGFAVTYDRWRLYLNLDAPLLTQGQNTQGPNGVVGAYQFTAPSLGLGTSPDTLSDARIGIDARLFGGPGGPFRLGASAQLFVPNGNRSDYDTDGTWRSMLRGLVAGDIGLFTYAGQIGVHIRPLDDSPTPGSPRGSELLFGLAGGARFPLGRARSAAAIVGPEIYGATAFRSPLGATSTGVEGLLTGRLEYTSDEGPQLRLKLGTGGGIDPHFGAPEWRVVVGIELFDRVRSR